MIELIRTQLEELGLKFRQEQEDRLVVGFREGDIDYEVHVIDKRPIIGFLVPSLAVVPAANMTEAIRLANRLNACHILLGMFYVDPEDRDLAFELVIAAPEGPSLDQLHLAFASVYHTLATFFPAFASLIWAGLDAEEAVKAAFARLQEPESNVVASEDDGHNEWDLAV